MQWLTRPALTESPDDKMLQVARCLAANPSQPIEVIFRASPFTSASEARCSVCAMVWAITARARNSNLGCRQRYMCVGGQLQVLGSDAKADRPYRDAGQEATAPLLGTGPDNDKWEAQPAQTVGQPAGLENPAADIPKLVNLLETGANWHTPCSRSAIQR